LVGVDELGQLVEARTTRTIAYVWGDMDGPSFIWQEGQIDVKGVRSDAEIGDIVQLARGLRATVQGDDGETYSDDGRPE
jgi:hypothetical protein